MTRPAATDNRVSHYHSLGLSGVRSLLETIPSPATQLRQEVENVMARLRYLGEAHQAVRNDIALTRRATEKTTSDVSKAQEEKMEQVL